VKRILIGKNPLKNEAGKYKMMRKRSRARPDISDHDRFGLTFLLTVIFHGIVILGVTFTFASPADSDSAPALDIILLQTQSPSEKKTCGQAG